MEAVRRSILALTALLVFLGGVHFAQARPPNDVAGLRIQRQLERNPPSAGIALRDNSNYANCMDAPTSEGSPFDCAAFKRKHMKPDFQKPAALKTHSKAPVLNYFGEGCENGCALSN
ncbi:hypothetical protein [Roseateles koreensis]|uniref:Uncharacterized protein n=1 Tax=Roseateles koreensis TaxID=2987526 RepID=A0ABT5KMT5_9BURK|nr:hypothetical protein [Roseateles koreensis]MDC8784229.1 hypothetical protein [Roseateles koreensis]